MKANIQHFTFNLGKTSVIHKSKIFATPNSVSPLLLGSGTQGTGTGINCINHLRGGVGGVGSCTRKFLCLAKSFFNSLVWQCENLAWRGFGTALRGKNGGGGGGWLCDKLRGGGCTP